MDSSTREPLFFWSKAKLATYGFVTLSLVAVMVFLNAADADTFDSNRRETVLAVCLVGVSQACLFFGLALGRWFALAAQLVVAIAAVTGILVAGAWFVLPLGWSVFSAVEVVWMLKLRGREPAD